MLVLIYTRAGEVLLLERRQPAGYWQSVTGSLHWHEAAGAAAQREVREETGLDVTSALIDCQSTNRFKIVPPWQARYAPGADTNIEHVFRVEYASRPVIRLDRSEHIDFIWLSAEQAQARATSRTDRDAIARFVPGG